MPCLWCHDLTNGPEYCCEECYEQHRAALMDPTVWDADVLAEQPQTQNGKVNR